jgi:uncharacterized cupredoxin-like copper-binding protein
MRVVAVGRAAGMVLLIAGSALLLACGGGGESKSSEGAKSGGAAAEGPVTVALSEWTVKPSSAVAKAGKVEFKVTNSGTTPHELMIVKTDVAPDKLEQAAGIVDEAKYKPLGRTKQLNGGQNEELSVDLTAGKYVLLCNVSGHYTLGMHTGFTVN